MENKNVTAQTVSTYETGVTQPGKGRGGVVAFLLMLVIFLSGVVTALGLMNVQMFRQLQTGSADKIAPVSFEMPVAEGSEKQLKMQVGTEAGELGIWYVYISGVCSEYYDIPQGLLVTSAEEDTGLMEGDILLYLQDAPLETEADLQAALQTCQSGQQVRVKLYRGSRQEMLEIVLTVR